MPDDRPMMRAYNLLSSGVLRNPNYADDVVARALRAAMEETRLQGWEVPPIDQYAEAVAVFARDIAVSAPALALGFPENACMGSTPQAIEDIFGYIQNRLLALSIEQE